MNYEIQYSPIIRYTDTVNLMVDESRKFFSNLSSMIPSLYHPIAVNVRKVKPFIRFLKLNTLIPKVGRKLELSIEQALAFGIFKQQHGIPTKITVYRQFQAILSCSYKTFVTSLNRWSAVAALILMFILKLNQQSQHPIKHIDSTIIEVCKFKNRKHHKTMQGLAQLGYSSNGAFFGLKLHLISDILGKIQSLIFTSGNVSDKDSDVVMKLAKNIWGLLIGDAGYVSQKLAKLFNRADRLFMAKPYKNMRVVATKLQGLLYGTRMLVERHFRVLKLFFGLVTSVPRSVTGYLGNYFYALLAYQLS